MHAYTHSCKHSHTHTRTCTHARAHACFDTAHSGHMLIHHNRGTCFHSEQHGHDEECWGPEGPPKEVHSTRVAHTHTLIHD